jgi:hypothetical protein
MAGTLHPVAILLAGAQPAAAPMPDEALKAAAMAEKLATEEAASIDQFLLSRTQTLKLPDCAEGKAGVCTLDAFILTPAPSSEKASRECYYDALVTEKVVMPDGSKVFAHIANLVIMPRRRYKPPRRVETLLRDPEAVAVTAAMLFDDPGFHPICFSEYMSEGQIQFRFHRIPPAEGEGVPDEVANAGPWSEPVPGILYGHGNGIDPSSQRVSLSFFESTFRSLRETVGCTITGCPEKLAVSITVRAEGAQLPILQRSRPTSYRTDTTIMVPRNQVGTLSVRYPDGTLQVITTCAKLQETQVSASYQCYKAK